MTKWHFYIKTLKQVSDFHPRHPIFGFVGGFFVGLSVTLWLGMTNKTKMNMNKMKHYRRFLLLLAMLPVGTFAKDNFKMTGEIDGVGNDTLCIEYVILQPQKQIVKRKIVVKNGEFSFSAKLHDAYMGLMHLKSKPQETLYTYFVPRFIPISCPMRRRFSVAV